MSKVNVKSTLGRITAKQEVEGVTQGLEPGKCYYIKGPRNDYVGQVVEVTGPYTVSLDHAAWVRNSGRLHLFLLNGEAPNMEVEPVGHAACVQVQDAFDWPHRLFEEPV